MATEKISKAYLWRTGAAPTKNHTGLVRILKALLNRDAPDRRRIAKCLGFARADDFAKWVAGNLKLAYELQNLAPAEANDGPNPEYPWPHETPRECPDEFEFLLWNEFSTKGKGRKFLEAVDRLIGNFARIT
jgi:hypothetical protein